MKKRSQPKQELDSGARQVAIYLRVSTQEQADSGLGIAAQETRCKALVTVKGWGDAVVYCDDGISGTLGPEKRPQLGLMLAAIAAHQISAVVVLDLSRLGRSVNLVTSLIEDFDRAGVAFVSCKENFDTSTAMGRAMMGIVAVFGQLERDLTAERTRAALDERGKRDGEKGGRLPYGYTRGPAGLVVDPDAAGVVKKIFHLRANRHTLRDIAAILQTPSPRGGAWFASGVREILINEPAYRGGCRGESAERWPAIL